MTIVSFDDGISEGTTQGKTYIYDFAKTAPPTVVAAGVFSTLWYLGGTPGAGSDGASGSGSVGAGGTAHTNETGAIVFADQTDIKSVVGLEGQLCQATTVAGRIILLDRLCSVGSISLTSVTTRNVNNVALPTRASDGVGVSMWAEVSTATTVTAPAIAANYTDTGNVSRTSPTVTFPAAATPQRTLLRIPWYAGGVGTKTVETISVTTAATAGAMTLVLAREIGSIPVTSNSWTARAFTMTQPQLPRAYDGASLMLAYTSANSATAPYEIVGRVVVLYG